MLGCSQHSSVECACLHCIDISDRTLELVSGTSGLWSLQKGKLSSPHRYLFKRSQAHTATRQYFSVSFVNGLPSKFEVSKNWCCCKCFLHFPELCGLLRTPFLSCLISRLAASDSRQWRKVRAQVWSFFLPSLGELSPPRVYWLVLDAEGVAVHSFNQPQSSQRSSAKQIINLAVDVIHGDVYLPIQFSLKFSQGIQVPFHDGQGDIFTLRKLQLPKEVQVYFLIMLSSTAVSILKLALRLRSTSHVGCRCINEEICSHFFCSYLGNDSVCMSASCTSAVFVLVFFLLVRDAPHQPQAFCWYFQLLNDADSHSCLIADCQYSGVPCQPCYGVCPYAVQAVASLLRAGEKQPSYM